MANRPTITLGICLATGLAAGIGLARPATTDGVPVHPAAAAPDPAPSPGPAADPTPTGEAVRIAGFDFGRPLAVAPGARITVDNADGVAHTLTAEGGAFDTGTITGGGRSTIAAPTDAGTYRFFCAIHPSMQGSLTVSNSDNPQDPQDPQDPQEEQS